MILAFLKNYNHETFCLEYSIDYNPQRAYLAAGYKEGTSVQQQSNRLLQREDVQKRLVELTEESFNRLKIDKDNVLREIARMSFFDPRKLFNDDGTPKDITELDDDTAACIGGLDVVSVGNEHIGVGQILKYKLNDKNQALEKLCKHLGLYAPEKKEVNMESKTITIVKAEEMEIDEQ